LILPQCEAEKGNGKLLIYGRCVRRSSDRTKAYSGNTGRTAGFTADGLSRSLIYSKVPSGRGTLNADSANPAGTGTECLNSESEATALIRNRLLPRSVHCLSGLSGQRTSFKVGTRTRVARGCQSPLAPASIARKWSGPNAEGPKLFSGSRVAITVWASCAMRLPSSKLRDVLYDPSAVDTSIFSVRGNVSGTSVFKKNESFPSCGSSS